MSKLFGAFLLAVVCAVLLMSFATADHHKPDDKLDSIDNLPAELKLPLDSILEGLRMRREAQGGQGQGNGGRRGPPSDGQGGQRGGQGGQGGGGGQGGQNSDGN